MRFKVGLDKNLDGFLAGVNFDGPYEEFTRTTNPGAVEYLRAMPVLHARPFA